jgi:hypothetical protein
MPLFHVFSCTLSDLKRPDETVLYFVVQDKRMVKVVDTPERPKYHCEKCDMDFPSTLDLEEHLKIDHHAAASMA